MGETGTAGGFWRRFAFLFAAGLVGVAALAPAVAPAVRAQLDAAGAPPMPFPLLLALSLVNPLILLAVAVSVGIRLAPRVGLVSLLDDRAAAGTPIFPRLRPHLPAALALGLAGGTLLIVLDTLLAPWAMAGIPEGQLPTSQSSVAGLVAGLLYGGVTEELLLRWGMMSFLAWAAWRFLARGRGRPGPSIMWGAIVGAAIAFGVAHLPALAATVPLTTPLVVRTVALNALGGILFGWLFWRRTLEAAMVAHASFHVAFYTLTLLFA